MKLLEAEPVVAPEVAPGPGREAPSEPPPSPEAARTCRACGAPMEPEQNWCLNCGTAAAGTLGKRPGWRAASTIIALTLLLVLGAVGASYAALTGGKGKPTAATPTPVPVQAQVTPTQTPPAQTTPTTPAQTTPTTPAKPSQIPKVKAPNAGSTTGSPITPAPTSRVPTTATPTSPAPTTSTPTTSTPTTSTPAQTPAVPKAIQLAGDAGKAYDPYHRIKTSGDTTRALDGDAATSWYVDPVNPQEIGVGYAVDLGKLQGIREIDLQTPTPGFRIEVYATDETTLPPDIIDTRWSHITNVSKVGAKDDGKQKIVLGAGTTKYRNLLLWFTQPPTDGPRLRLTELSLLG